MKRYVYHLSGLAVACLLSAFAALDNTYEAEYSSVEPDGTAWLDFNKAINPPCAFSPYATCPLPPKQNKLALAVSAGEKRYGDH